MKNKTLIDVLEGESLLNTLSAKNILDIPSMQLTEYEFYHIKELTFEEKLPRKEAFSNVLSALRVEGMNVIYLLMGDTHGVHFYLGVSKELGLSNDIKLDMSDIGDNILKSSIEGNFRGSKVEKVSASKKEALSKKIDSLKKVANIAGVPNEDKDDIEFQGVDRLIDVMFGDTFALLVIANPMEDDEIVAIEKQLHKIYNKLIPLVKKNIQLSAVNTRNESESNVTAVSKSENDSATSGHSANTSTSKNETKNDGETKSVTKGGNEQANESKSSTYSVGNTSSESTTHSSSNTSIKNEITNIELGNKALEEWIEYIDDVLLPMVNYGKSKGLFYSNMYLLANTDSTLNKLGNTSMALFSGHKENNKVPLKFKNVKSINEKKAIKNLQLPSADAVLTDVQEEVKILYSKYKNVASNWFSTNELSVIAGLPQKEVVGLTLKEEVDFGLNMKEKQDEDNLYLGHLVKSGTVSDIEICINKKDLDKHIFIAGVTGSGKTTTCQRLLKSADVPFMVIEPAKTEYRILTKTHKDLLIFTLGTENIAPFRLNPFEFFPHENITARVDMIKASIESAFDMEAAIPQIIEASIYKCYESYGWDISTNTNSEFENPFDKSVESFPTISDLIDMTKVVVEEQGFDDRLKNDYIGSIRSRLQGLIIGAKGFMLDTPRSLDFKDLVTKNIILELEEIKNPSQKSLIIGFILMNLNEAIKAVHQEEKLKGNTFKHITLIEEAHRLLAKCSVGDSPSKKQGVEVFADMLAEVRKYGESLIIVDQIPNKLTSEVLKNTNTKIVHRLFAEDDKEAIGNTMALNSDQKEFLSSLDVGRVVMFSQSFVKPIQVQIAELDSISTTQSEIIDEQTLRDNCLNYYRKNILEFDPDISLKDVAMFMHISSFWQEVMKLAILQKIESDKIRNIISMYHLENRIGYLVDFLIYKFYKKKDKEDMVDYLNSLCREIVKDEKNSFSKEDKKLKKFKGE